MCGLDILIISTMTLTGSIFIYLEGRNCRNNRN